MQNEWTSARGYKCHPITRVEFGKITTNPIEICTYYGYIVCTLRSPYEFHSLSPRFPPIQPWPLSTPHRVASDRTASLTYPRMAALWNYFCTRHTDTIHTHTYGYIVGALPNEHKMQTSSFNVNEMNLAECEWCRAGVQWKPNES